MAQVNEKPLTTKALNVFLSTAHTEIEKLAFTEYTKQNNLHDVASLIFSAETPLRTHKELGFVLAAKADGDFSKELPETLSELKRRVEYTQSDFEKEPDMEASLKLYKAALRRAYREAEKEMNRGVASR